MKWRILRLITKHNTNNRKKACLPGPGAVSETAAVAVAAVLVLAVVAVTAAAVDIEGSVRKGTAGAAETAADWNSVGQAPVHTEENKTF